MTDTPSAAPEVFDALKRVGIDITAAFQVLEDETVSTFEASSRGPARHDDRTAQRRVVRTRARLGRGRIGGTQQ